VRTLIEMGYLMRRPACLLMTSLTVASLAGPARAHELWFQPIPPGAPVARLTFGDSSDAGDAESGGDRPRQGLGRWKAA
jgi:hypothetical protein